MAQPVKLSDPLINVARKSAAAAHRSLAAQVEHWATLGHAVEGALTADQVSALKHQVHEPEAARYVTPDRPLSASLAKALSRALAPEAQSAWRKSLATASNPVYGTDPAFPGCLVRRNPDGSVTPGRWESGQFVELRARPKTQQRATSRVRRSSARS